jgi:hypothetical protein
METRPRREAGDKLAAKLSSVISACRVAVHRSVLGDPLVEL